MMQFEIGVNLIAKDTAWLTERKRIKSKVVLEKFRRRINR